MRNAARFSDERDVLNPSLASQQGSAEVNGLAIAAATTASQDVIAAENLKSQLADSVLSGMTESSRGVQDSLKALSKDGNDAIKKPA